MKDMSKAARTAAWTMVARWCKEHPGEWALVSDDIHHSTAVHVGQGRITAFRPAGDFQAIIRGGKGSRGSLYVRYSPADNPARKANA